MIDGLKPYRAIRDSGVPWLGSVPEHWKMLRGKVLFRCIDTRSSTGAEELLTVSSERGVVPRSSATVTMFKAESYLGYKLCWPGDLVINSLWAWARGLGVSPHHGIVSSAYGVYRLRPHYSEYSWYIHELVRSTPFNWELQVRSKGIWISRLQLTDEAFLGAPFPLPPPEEQATIVRFLDHADRRIRRYIRAKQKLIKLLEEQKQAIIHRAVTRGLDPNIRLKPSGVEWLGDVPEHWEVVRLKSLVSRVTSGSRGWSNFAADSGVLFIRIGNLTRASLDLDFERSVRLSLPAHVLGEAARTRVQPDDILLSITAFIGSVAVAPPDIEEAYVSQHVACCRTRVEIANPRWVGYVLLSSVGQTQGQLSMYGGTKQGLSLDDVKNYVVLLPPLDEQDRLVEWIERETATLSEGVKKTKRDIELLREYRTRLVADVVTGKLDVREAAARLPDEAEKPETLDEIEAEDEAEGAGADDTDEVPEEAEA
jgi:type I restriction enzyme S subunit